MRVLKQAAVLVGLLAGGTSTAHAQYCYECREGIWWPANQCMDCWHPVIIGHVSCIPYCNGTCSVGASCTGGMLDLRLAPDGSLWGARSVALLANNAFAVQPVGSGRAMESVARNCLGAITMRSYDIRAVERIRRDTRRIIV